MSRHFELLKEFRASHAEIIATDLSKVDERILVYEMCIKAGDIGHAAKEIVLHEKWTLLVCEEFFIQGDLEKQQGLPVSMYCDRSTTNIPKVPRTQSQIGFIQNIVLPLYEALNAYFSSDEVSTICIEQLRVNMQSWERQMRQKKRRFTIKDVPANISGRQSDFEKLAEKVRGWKRG